MVEARRPDQRKLARRALQPENQGTKAKQPPTITETEHPLSGGGRITGVNGGNVWIQEKPIKRQPTKVKGLLLILKTKIKKAFNNRYQKEALRLVANVPRNIKPSYLTWASEGLRWENNRRALTCFYVRRNLWRRSLTRRDPNRGRVDWAEILVVVERVTRISHQQMMHK